MARLRAAAIPPELLPGLLAVGVFVVWAAADGGFESTVWYPGALFALGLLVVTVFALRRRTPAPPIATRVAIACLLGFTVWCFASIGWADDRGAAWDGANQTALYLTVFILFALPAWRREAAVAVLATYSLGIAALAGLTLLDAATSLEGPLAFIDGRLADPVGYHNGTAALFLGAAFPALFLASRRETPWPLRAALLAAVVVLVEAAVLPQSRGSLIALPIALAAYFAFVPGRLRSGIALAPVVVAVALSAGTLLDVYEAFKNEAGVERAIDAAGRAVAFSALAVLFTGIAVGLADRRMRIGEDASRRARRGFAALAAFAGLVAAVVALSAIGNPVEWAEERWKDFRGGYSEQGFGESRFGGQLGSNRYDFWRVALDEWSDSPLAGIGADNFAAPYLLARESEEEPLHPHSLEVRILSQTGLVGALLLAAFVAAAVTAVIRSSRRGSAIERGLGASACIAALYWLIHGSADWFWPIPALTAPAFAWIALAGRLVSSPTTAIAEPPPRARRRELAATIAVVVAAVALAASHALPWAAARDVERAAASWGADPEAAFDRLDRAASLNFLSEKPAVTAGAIAVRLGQLERAGRYFANAVDRAPDNWYPVFELGAVRAVEGRDREALRWLRRAAALNPRDALVRSTLVRVRAGRPVSLRTIDRVLLGRVCERVGRTEATRFCR